MAMLEVNDLKTHFRTERGVVRAVDGVTFSLEAGQTLGVVGESGSGKSVLSRSIMNLLPKRNVIREGTVTFAGQLTSSLGAKASRKLYGTGMAMIFQDPMTSLNPVVRIGRQITESLKLHFDMKTDFANDAAEELLRSVGIPEPRRRLREYPHQLSGGMRQRVVIAIALSCGPKLLFADEPTTALDVTVQAQILELLKEIQHRTGAALMLITHDLGVIAEMVDNVVVMYAGEIVEQGTVAEVLLEPRMPYTMGLIESIPTVEKRGGRLSAIKGVVPSPFHLPPACRFEPRCPYQWETCRTVRPELYPAGAVGQLARCHLHLAESRTRLTAAVDQHEQNMRVGRRLTGAPDRLGNA